MRTFLLTGMALLVLVAGCKRKAAQPKASPPSTSQAADEPAAQAAPGDASVQEAMPKPSKAGLTDLCADPNPYISNNAKRALASWETRDYASAAIGMIKLRSLVKAPAQQEAVFSGLAALKLEIDQAAAQGNAKAKEAAAILARAGSP